MARAITLHGNVWTLHTNYFPVPAERLWMALGFIPAFLDAHDPLPAVEQLKSHYQWGWHPIPRGSITLIDGKYLKYPGDPLMYPLATLELDNGERVMVYEASFVCVVHKDRTYEVSRMD